MPNPLHTHAAQGLRPLRKKEVAKGAILSGIFGLGLFALGLTAMILIGLMGTMSGGAGVWAVVIGLGCVFLMFPSAVILGIGILLLNLSATGMYSLIVGKPVYGITTVVDFRPKCPDSM
jgi:hypothetical protein